MAEQAIIFQPPTAAYNPNDVFPPWRDVFPFLEEVRSQWKVIREEVKQAGNWTHWPEFNLYHPEQGQSWRVVPFCYTIPANDPSQTTWVAGTESQCPRTAALLRRIPGIRTALFSKMGPGTSLAPHQGWAVLSNHVLRCHLALDIPAADATGFSGPASGVIVEDMQVQQGPTGEVVTAGPNGGVICAHAEGEIIVFDDSRIHSAFNHSNTASRVVLIFDIARPAEALPGFATGDTTAELESFIEYFK